MPLRVAGARCGWPSAPPLSGPARRDPWAAGAPRAAALRLAWRVAERSGAGVRTGWPRAPTLAASNRTAWQSARPLSAPAQRVPWGWLPAHASASRLPWAAAHALAAPAERLPWGSGRAATSPVRLAWQPATARARHARMAWGSATAHTAGVRLPWWREFSPITAGVRGPWDHEPDPDPDVSRFLVPLRLVYAMFNEATVTRLPSGATVEVGSLTLTEDADGGDIDVSLEVLGPASLDLVAPGSTGEPAILQALVNGLPWQFIAEDWDCTEEHGTLSVARVRGRSLSALLGAPFSSVRDYTEAATRSLAQLADQELPAAGWTLDWQAADWSVPAGAWTYQALSPAQAIGRCAEAAGAIVMPARAAQTLTVQPRYPVLPWDWQTTAPDYEVPRDVLLRASGRYPQPEQANGVYVHGGPVGGVLAWARRTGSAGDRLAATVEDALLTTPTGARARAARILAGQAAQPALSAFTLPLGGPDFPAAQLGQLFRINGAGMGQPDVYGIATSVTITCQRDARGALAIEQTIGLGERTPNLWAAWQRLLPTDPRRVATVSTDHGDGTVTVTLTGGGTLRILGTATPGATVYLRTGRIEGPAPALPDYVLDV